MSKYRGIDSDEGWIQRKFRDLERQIKEERSAKRLQFSSIDPEFTLTPEGPKESEPLPTPDGLTITAGAERIDVTWSGSASAPLPADFDRLAVHVSKVPGFTPTQGTEVTAIGSPTGGTVTYDADADTAYYVRSCLVSLRGAYGPFTDELEVTPTALTIDGAVVTHPHAYRAMGAQSIPSGVWTAITSWTDVEIGDVTTTTSEYVVNVAGWYAVTAQAAFAANSSNKRGLRVLRNGDTVNPIAYNARSADTTTAGTYLFATTEERLEVGDVLLVQVYQNSGAALDVMGTPGRGKFFIHRISI